ncbi:MAG: hypothetical protein WBN75_04255, partial [Verrucomicrobiia bacterium]
QSGAENRNSPARRRRSQELRPEPALARSADFQVCWIAGFQTRCWCNVWCLPTWKSATSPESFRGTQVWKPALQEVHGEGGRKHQLH